MKDKNGTEIKVGDKIKAIKPTHLLRCQDNFSIDLSDPVTVHIDERGVLMAGQVSLKSYKNRIVEII